MRFHVRKCMRTEMVVNTLHNPIVCMHSLAATHYIILRGVVYAKCTNGIFIVVWLTVALDETLVTVE